MLPTVLVGGKRTRRMSVSFGHGLAVPPSFSCLSVAQTPIHSHPQARAR